MIGVIAFVSIFSGCANKKNSTPPQAEIQETDESMTELTYETVKELNKNSNLLGITLLDAVPSDVVVPGPNLIGTGEDYFNCFLFDGEYRITQIGLLSETANVYGIAVGDSLSKVEETLTTEDFKQWVDEDINASINENENVVTYQLGYLTLIFYIDKNESTTSDATITKILINVDNPSEEKPTF